MLIVSAKNRRDGVVVRAFASQSVDLGFIFQVESNQKTLKNGIQSLPVLRSTHKEWYGNKPASLTVVPGQKPLRDASILLLQIGGGAKRSSNRGGPVKLKISKKG